MTFDWNLLLLVLAGFIAGCINTLAGGGSLITLPTLIFLGLPPGVANGTNRIAIFLQTMSATAGFRSKGVNPFPFSIYIGISALIGAIIGAQIAVDIKGEAFNKILAVVMTIVVLVVVFKPKIKTQDFIERTEGKYKWIAIVAFFFFGIYGGFLNAGLGFVVILFLNHVNRMTLVKANATKVSVILIYMAAALLVFILNDKVNWKLGLILALGNTSGAWLASRWSVKKGDKAVKIVLLIVVPLMAIKLWFF